MGGVGESDGANTNNAGRPMRLAASDATASFPAAIAAQKKATLPPPRKVPKKRTTVQKKVQRKPTIPGVGHRLSDGKEVGSRKVQRGPDQDGGDGKGAIAAALLSYAQGVGGSEGSGLFRSCWQESLRIRYQENRATSAVQSVREGKYTFHELRQIGATVNGKVFLLKGRVSFSKGIQGNGNYDDEVRIFPPEMLEEFFQSLKEGGKHLPPSTFAQQSPELFWSFVYHTSNGKSMKMAIDNEMEKHMPGSLMGRDRTLSEKAKENLRQSEDGVQDIHGGGAIEMEIDPNAKVAKVHLTWEEEREQRAKAAMNRFAAQNGAAPPATHTPASYDCNCKEGHHLGQGGEWAQQTKAMDPNTDLGRVDERERRAKAAMDRSATTGRMAGPPEPLSIEDEKHIKSLVRTFLSDLSSGEDGGFKDDLDWELNHPITEDLEELVKCIMSPEEEEYNYDEGMANIWAKALMKQSVRNPFELANCEAATVRALLPQSDPVPPDEVIQDWIDYAQYGEVTHIMLNVLEGDTEAYQFLQCHAKLSPSPQDLIELAGSDNFSPDRWLGNVGAETNESEDHLKWGAENVLLWISRSKKAVATCPWLKEWKKREEEVVDDDGNDSACHVCSQCGGESLAWWYFILIKTMSYLSYNPVIMK